MEVPRRNRPLASVLGTLAALLVLLLLGAILAIWIHAGLILQRIEPEVAEGDPQRHVAVPLQPLFPDPLPDDALAHFSAAMESIQESRQFLDATGGLGFNLPPLDFPPQSVLESIWDRGHPAVDEVGRALRCSRIFPDEHRLSEAQARVGPVLLVGAELARRQGRAAEALNRLVLLLGMSQAWPGFGMTYGPARFEASVVWEWNEVLDGHTLTADESAGLCALLDRLESSRKTLLGRVREQCRYRRIDALGYTRPDENGYTPGTNVDPGPRHLWTRRLLACEALQDTESDFRELSRICGLPWHEQIAAVEAFEESISWSRVRIQRWSSHPRIPVDTGEFTTEVYCRMFLRMERLATALAWFEAEWGRLPESLPELVPRYLSRLEPCPVTGQPVQYENGALVAPGWDQKHVMVWPVRRR
jgi:hypothetical protein